MLDLLHSLIRFFVQGYMIGFLVLTLMALVVAYVVSKQHKLRNAILAGLLVSGGLIIPVVILFYPTYAKNQAKIERYQTAKAIFDERCKTAGEKIYKTVDNVEGITLLKVRPNLYSAEYLPEADPMWADAGLPSQYKKDVYIESFMKWALGHSQKGSMLAGKSSLLPVSETSMEVYSHIGA